MKAKGMVVVAFAAGFLAVANAAETQIPVGWNANAEWFMYAPSFAFKEVPVAAKYRFRVLDDFHVTREFVAAKPSDSLAPVWDFLPKGFVTVSCFALGAKDEVIGLAGERTFWKNAAYREGTYPKAKRPYAEAVKMGLEYLLDREANRYFLEQGRPDPSYDLNCYPAKMHAATIEAMCDYQKADLPRKDEALKLARLCADYLIEIAEPEGRPLAGWPHTYEGTNNTASVYKGQQMLVYPASAGSAFLSLYAVTKDVQYLTAARRIAATYLKLQGEDGTWFLKLYEKDGQPVNPNRLMPNGVIDFLERLYGVTGEQCYRMAADKAFAYIDRGPLRTWNWEGQFEDVPPSEPYFNLTKHSACDTAIYLLNRFPKDVHRQQQAAGILRWAEDQFIAWEVPARKDGIGFRNRPGFTARWTNGWQTAYSTWHCPAVMEQYSWYQPIDASAAKLIRTYLAYYEATGDHLAIAKARTLGDAVVNNQLDDGLSPTGWFGNYDEYHHWINCHIAAMRALGALCVVAQRGVVASVVSPDGKNEIRLWGKPLAYEVLRDGVSVVRRSEVGMRIDGKCLTCASEDAPAPRVVSRALSGTVETPIYKKSRIDLSGNEAFADFGSWGIRLAARNDGVAYRFETEMPGRIVVSDERADLTIPYADTPCALNYGKDFGCEETIPLSCKAAEIETGKTKDRRFVYLPFAYSVGRKHVAVTESDVCDYPIWNLERGSEGKCVVFNAAFAGWPLEQYHGANGTNWDHVVELPTGGRWVKVRRHADYLVETEGTRTFPWRTFVLADEPSKFCEADIVTVLARGEAGRDFSWVKPGKVAWDWWNAWDNKGVKEGCNTATYRRFIDFAAKNGIEYVILDEGWSESLNIWKFNPDMDVPALIRYGGEKGVGIILWMAWAQIYGDESRVARHFAQLGAKGFKVDFMDRGDADCERFLWKFADECAKNRMLVDYHGAHRPTGMSRAYPNVLNYEGVHGLECAKWFKNEYDFPDSDVKQFFLRMTAGPLDYTPGAMDNYPVGCYAGKGLNPGSVGTRCRQMALMVLYEAPLQMLCDAPTKYGKNMECFRFMAATPVVWADTVGLGGGLDTFAAVARKTKDGSWYAAAINNKEARDFMLDTSFLGSGEWRAEVFRDAPDAAVEPTHYVHDGDGRIVAGSRLACQMGPGGGFVARFFR